MTPAIEKAKKAKINFDILEYQHDPAATNYGSEAAEKLNLSPDSVFKTLLVALTGHKSPLAVAVIPVANTLSLKAIAKALGAKKADMADPKVAERSTGYLVGGISPIGQKKALPTVVDDSSKQFERIHVSAGRRGLEISLQANDLVTLTRGIFGKITAE
ncbi:MAG: Cys-tRNA(Pro)/Cys-tRNA(Cys) deacylase [Thalassolituus sp.]|jgi:Cys-tRNA(Pro)/Cys-tRNA(Cys) deacylase|tara:strand:+ start:24700 stop:25176 length:477 start_codon:yes stop_codon:yes gene_type:complete